jgi:two-component system, OmpR family, response regulator AdeR
MIVYQLEKTGATLVTAEDGLETWKMFLRENIDLVLLDIRLPEMDGYQVLSQIRSRNKMCLLLHKLPMLCLMISKG